MLLVEISGPWSNLEVYRWYDCFSYLADLNWICFEVIPCASGRFYPDQGPENYNPWTKSVLLPVFVSWEWFFTALIHYILSGYLSTHIIASVMLGKIEGRRRRATEHEMVGWYHWLNRHGFEWTLGVGDGQGGLTCCSSWSRKESETTERLNWTESKMLTGPLEKKFAKP